MADQSNEFVAEYNQFFAEIARVCPEAPNGLAVSGSPPPMLSRRDLITILRALPANAGGGAFLATWEAFAAANPAAIIPPSDT